MLKEIYIAEHKYSYTDSNMLLSFNIIHAEKSLKYKYKLFEF